MPFPVPSKLALIWMVNETSVDGKKKEVKPTPWHILMNYLCYLWLLCRIIVVVAEPQDTPHLQFQDFVAVGILVSSWFITNWWIPSQVKAFDVNLDEMDDEELDWGEQHIPEVFGHC